jgi:hypothetical protein
MPNLKGWTIGIFVLLMTAAPGYYLWKGERSARAGFESDLKDARIELEKQRREADEQIRNAQKEIYRERTKRVDAIRAALDSCGRSRMPDSVLCQLPGGRKFAGRCEDPDTRSKP